MLKRRSGSLSAMNLKPDTDPKTNFIKVCEFNKAFGLPHYDKSPENILDNKKLVDLRVSLCIEEIKELVEAFEQKDFIEVIDALTDELYVLYGAGSSLGINLDEKFKKALYRLYNYNIDNLPDTITFLSNFNLLRYCIEHARQKHILPLIIKKNMFNSDIDQVILDLKKKLVNDVHTLEENNTLDQISDILVNLLINTYKMGMYLAINLDKSFDIVHKSNMSKLCTSKKEAEQTVKWYKGNEKRYDTPDYRLSDSKKYYVVYNKSTGKILKSINYTPAKFDSLL